MSDVTEASLQGEATVELFWLPLGAGGHSVRLNGRVYEAITALRQRRERRDLYHAALQLRLDGHRYVIELAPVADAFGPERRRVVASGPVGSRWAGRFRIFRYELRCWPDGTIPDIGEAVASPVVLSHDPQAALRILDAAPQIPCLVWGRDELGAGEMWNSNSVVSWLIARANLDANVLPPPGGLAPGWDAGLLALRWPALMN